MPTLDVAVSPQRSSAAMQRAVTMLILGLVAFGLIWLAINPGATWHRESLDGLRPGAAAPALPPALAVPNIVAPQSYKPLTELDAVAENARRPLDKRRLEIAFPFLLPGDIGDTPAWARAVHCLALANYYEAASEGDAGMRAVSQVVLNRMRHPAFPHSVCDVVFQGSERATGCQFTFTCDGSLNRPPVPALFARARLVAEQALSGRVEMAVGMATHYHANRVVPYWADELDKIRTVGNHIFYVWRGTWGNRSVFRAAYSGERATGPLPYLAVTPAAALALTDSATAPLASSAGRINLVAVGPGASSRNRTFLAADEPAGTLKVDEDDHAGTLRTQAVLVHSGEKVLIDER